MVIMRRTVRLATLVLNKNKRDQITGLEHSYAKLKDRFLILLAPSTMWVYLDNKRSFRDYAKQEGLYPKDVHVHLVDQAAFDAVDTWIRHIESVITISEIKAKIWRRFQGIQRHYAYSLLTSYKDIGSILQGHAPAREKIQISGVMREEVCRFLHQHLRDAFSSSTNPRSHLSRSLSLDETMYSIWTVKQPGRKPSKRQYISIVSNQKGKRIVLPLAGISRISGNIRLVMDEGTERGFIHVPYEIKQMDKASGPRQSIDWGITEVATNKNGNHYGEGYGKVLEHISESRKLKGQRRGKLWSLTKKNAGSRKGKLIAKHNLGTKKQTKCKIADRSTLRTITGAAVKEVVYGDGNRTRACGAVAQHSGQRPNLIVHEDLSHLRGKAKSKKLSRLCSSWMRSELEGRMTVHTYRGCSPTKAVNAAYTSQTCPKPDCGYVDSSNRNGDEFHCRNPYWDCNWQGDADQVAAMNLDGRIGDPDITLFTTHTEVKRILLDRFQRRLESRTGVTSLSCDVEGNATAHGRTPSKPQRPCPDVGGINEDADSQSPVHTVRTGETQRLESEEKGVPRYA